jgi:uncharacterized protein YdhG (YjbR/CyaY superfamily)
VTNIDEFIEAGTDEARATLKELRRVIRSAAPKATEAISYGIPVFKHEGLLVGFSAYKDHYSFFVMGTSVMHAFKNELKSYDTSKGTIRFPLDRPLPFALVRKIVKARVRENESRPVRRRRGSRRQPPGRTDGLVDLSQGWPTGVRPEPALRHILRFRFQAGKRLSIHSDMAF